MLAYITKEGGFGSHSEDGESQSRARAGCGALLLSAISGAIVLALLTLPRKAAPQRMPSDNQLKAQLLKAFSVPVGTAEVNVGHTDSCPIVLNRTLFYAESHLAIYSNVASIDQCCEMCRTFDNCTAFSLGEANAAIPGLAGRCFLKAVADGECPLDLASEQDHVVSGMPFDNGCYATATTTTTTVAISVVPVGAPWHGPDVNWNLLWLALLLLLLLLLCIGIWAFMPRGRRQHHKYRGVSFPIATALVVPPPMPPMQMQPPMPPVSRAQQVNTYTEGFVDGMAAAIATGHGQGRKSAGAWPPPE
jgi:hypothetical protein